MIWRSFRVRIALLATVLSGLGLTALAAYCWMIVWHVGLGRIDHEMVSRSFRYLAQARDGQTWPELDRSLQAAYGGHEPGAVAILVLAPDKSVLYHSPNWPEGLDSTHFPPPPPPPPHHWGPPPPPDPNDPASWSLPPEDGPPPPPPPGGPRPRGVGPPRHRTYWRGHEPWRLVRLASPDATLLMGTRLDGFVADFGRIRRRLVLGVLAGLFLVGGGGWLFAGRALRPVAKLTATVERVTATGLDQRILVQGEVIEFERLVEVFNQMLDRLERSFQQAARFSADAAHELKTPLTILQGELEEAHRQAPEGSAQQHLCGSLLDEVQRLKAITRKLLLLSLADAGKLGVSVEPVDLSELVVSLAEDAQALAPELTVDVAATPYITVNADAHLLQQALGNLTQNAAKYNRADGRIGLNLRRDGEWLELLVSNTGPGIPPADRPRVFERFYRADPAHGRTIDGVGLGLSLAREIVRAHGGEIQLIESRADRTTFRVRLPAA